MKTLLACLLLFIPSAFSAQTPKIEPGVSQELAKWRAEHYSDVRYKLNLTLEKMSPVLKGTIEIRVKLGGFGSGGAGSAVPNTLSPNKAWISAGQGDSFIILDWRKIKGSENLSTISNVSVNGLAAERRPMNEFLLEKPDKSTYTEAEDHLFIWNVSAGENVIKLDFTSPILPSGSAITRYVDKEDGSEYIYSLFVPSDASTAFPVFDQPDLKARFRLIVTAPKDWRVVSNSRISGSLIPDCFQSACPNSTYFFNTRPISTYVFAFTAGPWMSVHQQGDSVSAQSLPESEDTIGKRPVIDLPRSFSDEEDTEKFHESAMTIYVRKSQAVKFQPHAAEVFRLNREAIKYFEQYFDYKFPFPKYDLVLIPEFPFGGMEHAGATFLRESSIIFPQEPTKNDYVSRATLIFHETAHQWFGDTVTMRWFDDLWLKEGFATFMAYKAMEKIMPEYNAWKVFYERVKQAAYQTDSTKGTTAIYQPIANLSAAKSAYGNIVYNKAPAFLRQAEFYLGEDKFQTAVRALLKKHEFGNGRWEDLVSDFARAKYDLPPSGGTISVSQAQGLREITDWANRWIKQRGVPVVRWKDNAIIQTDSQGGSSFWVQRLELFQFQKNPDPLYKDAISRDSSFVLNSATRSAKLSLETTFAFSNYQDYGYGIFLLDDKSRDYVLKNIQNEKDPFLRSMMWGALWDSVREGELDPREYVELVVKVLSKSYAFTRETNMVKNQRGITPEGVTLTEDESTIATLLGRVGTAMNYYISDAERVSSPHVSKGSGQPSSNVEPSLTVGLRTRVENLLIDRMQNAETLGQRITYYRAFLNVASSEKARKTLKDILNLKFQISDLKLKTKDKFDIVTRLLILGDRDAPRLLAELEKTETSDDAKRYAYAAKAGIGTAENKAKYWNDFINNKDISESWIEAAFGPWNSIRHSEMTSPYLQKALQELPNHKRNRKIFFVNGWLGAFIGGQRSEEALAIINKFLADNPSLDNDLRLKILENADLIERAVRIRAKYKGN